MVKQEYLRRIKMKRYLIILFAVSVSWFTLNAEPVSSAEAKKVADRFVDLFHKGDDLIPGEVVSYAMDNGTIGYHVVQFTPAGWVMVSGDDVMVPVIGYSFENEYVPVEKWGEAARAWFDKLERHILEIFEKPALPENDQWEDLFNEGYKKSTAGTVVEPFIPVLWNQGAGWNRFCPEDTEGPGGHAYVGCVAVSMAQAMSVYEYPVNPTGEHTYIHPDYGTQHVNFDNQSYDWSIMSKTSSDDENAKLLYHLAVTVDMDFGADGSGSFTNRIPGALRQYFGYSQSVTYRSRSGYSDAEWKQMLIDELVQGRPLIYSGDGDNNQAGHAFNIDGVGAAGNYFHLNWGWSGNYNGYFTLDALIPGNNNFSYNQAAVIGIKPVSAGPYDLELSNLSVYEDQPVGTFVGKVTVADEFDDNVYTFELKGRFNVFLEDFGPADFYIENDSLKTSKVFDVDKNATEPLRVIVTDTLGNFYSEDFVITIKRFFNGPTAVTLSDTIVEEGKSPGYFVGTIQIEDDIPSNEYNFSFMGGYVQDMLTDADCFYVRSDSLFTNRIFYMSEGPVYYMQMNIADNKGHLLQEHFQISVYPNTSGATNSEVQEISPNFVIAPNPASAQIRLDFTGLSGKQAFIRIYSASGQQVMECYVHPNQVIDVSGLQNGVYLIVLTHGNTPFQRKLIVYN